jgi:transcriptional regulator with XRE-family HTH domain
MEDQTKTNNRLWQARRRRGLEQKQVAHLLGHKTCNQVSRYERGEKLPGFRTALKLEIILQTPVRELFPDLYENFRARISERAFKTTPACPPENENPEPPTGAHICTYETLILQRNPGEDAVELARRHSVKIVRELGEAVNARKIQL